MEGFSLRGWKAFWVSLGSRICYLRFAILSPAAPALIPVARRARFCYVPQTMNIVEDPNPYWDPKAKTSRLFVIIMILFGLALIAAALILFISN